MERIEEIYKTIEGQVELCLSAEIERSQVMGWVDSVIEHIEKYHQLTFDESVNLRIKLVDRVDERFKVKVVLKVIPSIVISEEVIKEEDVEVVSSTMTSEEVIKEDVRVVSSTEMSEEVINKDMGVVSSTEISEDKKNEDVRVVETEMSRIEVDAPLITSVTPISSITLINEVPSSIGEIPPTDVNIKINNMDFNSNLKDIQIVVPMSTTNRKQMDIIKYDYSNIEWMTNWASSIRILRQYGFDEEDISSLPQWITGEEGKGRNKVPDLRVFLDRFGSRNECEFEIKESNITGMRHRGAWNIEDGIWLQYICILYRNIFIGGYPSYQETIRINDRIRMFLDLEHDNESISDEDIITLMRALEDEYYNIYDRRSIVEKTRPFFIRNEKNGHRKVHCHLPDLITTKSILKRLVDKVIEHHPNLAKYIDKNMSGLRLVHNYKKPDENGYEDNQSVYRPHPYSDPMTFIIDNVLCRIRAFEWETEPSYRQEVLDQGIDIANDVLDIELMDPNLVNQILPKLDQVNFNIKVKSMCIVLERKNRSHCEICNREHQNDNMTVYCSSGIVWLKCWRGDKIQLMKHRKINDREKYERFMRTKRNLRTDRYRFIIPHYVTIDRYDERWIRPLDINKRIQLIQSKMDSRKTVELINFLIANRDILKKGIFLTNRRDFAINLESRLKEAGFGVSNYLTDGVEGNDWVIIQAESLHKLDIMPNIVIIDEVTSFLTQMDSGLHKKNLSDNQENLTLLLSKCQWFVGMDADIDERVCHILHHFRPDDEIFLQHNIRKRGQDEIINAYEMSELEMWRKMTLMITEGKNIHIVLGSEAYGVEYIEPFLKQLNIPYWFIHGKGDDRKEDKMNINQAVTQYRILMHTSAMNNGVDINVEHFHSTLVFGTSNSNHIREIKQMMGRVRKLIDHDIYYFNKTRCHHEPETHTMIRNTVISKIKTSNDIAMALLTNFERRSYVAKEGKVRWTFIDSIWSWLHFENRKEVNLSRNHYGPLFDNMLEDQGFIVHRLITSENIDSFFDDKGKKIVSKQDKEDNEKLSSHKQGLKADSKKTKIEKMDELPLYLNPTYIKERQSKITNGDATALEKLSVQKYELLQAIIPEHRPKLTNIVFVDVENEIGKLHNARCELDLNPRQALERDYEEEDVYRLKFTKIGAIGLICKELEIRNTVDRRAVIPCSRIKNKLEFFRSMYPAFRDIFNLRGAQPKDFQGVSKMLQSIFKSWSGSRMKDPDPSKQRINGKQVWTYNYRLLPATDHFDEVLQIMKIKISDGLPMIKDYKGNDVALIIPKKENKCQSANIDNDSQSLLNRVVLKIQNPQTQIPNSIKSQNNELEETQQSHHTELFFDS